MSQAPSGAGGIGEPHGQSIVLLLALVTGIQALATFAVLALPTLAPKAARTFAIAPQDIGYQISCIYAAAAFFSSIAGLVVRRLGAARSSLSALGAGTIGLLAISSGSIPAALLGSLLLGAGYGLTNPAASHLLVRFAPPGRRNLIFAIKQAGVPIGGMTAALLLPGLSERIGWQWAIAVSTVMFAGLAIPVVRRIPHWDDDRDTTIAIKGAGFPGITTIFASPMLTSLAIMGGCYAGYQFCLMAFTITMLVAEFGWSLVDAGLAATAVQIAGIGGRLSRSVLADRLGQGLDVLIGIGIASVVLGIVTAMIGPGWPTPAVLATLVAFGWCIVGWNGVYMGETTKASGPGLAGLATGGVLAFNFIGVILAPAVFALVTKLTGSFAISFGIFAIMPLAGVGCLLRARAVARRKI